MNQALLALADLSFPLAIVEHEKTHLGPLFEGHLHQNHLQLFYFTQGSGVLYCNQQPYTVTSPGIFLVNNNQLHYGETHCETLRYFVFRIDLKQLASYAITACTEKYLAPLQNNLILFENEIKDTAIENLLKTAIDECRQKADGYELKLIASSFTLLAALFRSHVKISFSHENAELLAKKAKRFSRVFDYMNSHYTEPISLKSLSEIAFMSEGYFCRMFKQTTGRTPTDYMNRIRIEKAVLLLNQGVCNVTETALSVGFDNVNYFCRIFKKYMKQSPTEYIQNDRRYFI